MMKKEWWHGKTAYQIYPKSFYDSNHDGIGDIRGIVEKLDYLKELGIDLIWISPVYLSPCADQGYDISDYYQIDPVFGTMEDMDQLLEEAKKRGIGVVMDLVVNHCSDEHEWFKKACEDPEGEYGKYFYLEKKRDGKLPCNWRSYFGGPVWEPMPNSDWYYLHVFHKKQPDLNWENPVVRERIYEMINFWLDKGLAGFRIDAIINIKKPQMFRDYPADREDQLCDMGTVLADTTGIGDFLREMRDRTFRPHGAFSVGEVFNAKDGELADFAGEDGYFSSIFDFRQTVEGKSVDGWYRARIPSPDDYKRCCFESQREMEGVGFYSNIIENHDEPRGVSHYLPEEARNEKGKKLLAALYFMLKGLPFIYQGQELGMENKIYTAIDQVDDISSRDEYQVCLNAGLSPKEAMEVVSRYSRDNARTPFQWSDQRHAGFTKGEPWLKVNENYKEINLEKQLGDPDSVFSFYQQLIRLRKDPKYQDTIIYGKTVPILEEELGIMAYFRQGEGQKLLVAGNFGSERRRLPINGINGKKCKVLLSNDKNAEAEEGVLILEGLQVVVAEM
jgi:oligo-1,6-glucosidase